MLVNGFLAAITTDYYMKAVGIKIAQISIQQNKADNYVEIRAKSVRESSIFPQINNVYRVKHNGSYQPLTYTRIIHQKNVQDEVTTTYNHNTAQAVMYRNSDKSTLQYSIAKNSQDIYSFLAKVISGQVDTGTYPIDANGVSWQANITRYSTEIVDTPLGKYPAVRYEISFQNMTNKKMPYIDMVTFNMLQENNKLNLWVYNRQFAVKATFKKKGISSTWELFNMKK